MTGHDWNQKNCGQESVDLSQTVECWNLFFAPLVALVKAPRIGFAIRAEVDQQLLDFQVSTTSAQMLHAQFAHVKTHQFLHVHSLIHTVTIRHPNKGEYHRIQLPTPLLCKVRCT